MPAIDREEGAVDDCCLIGWGEPFDAGGIPSAHREGGLVKES